MHDALVGERAAVNVPDQMVRHDDGMRVDDDWRVFGIARESGMGKYEDISHQPQRDIALVALCPPRLNQEVYTRRWRQ
jgi:hypothetical protein